MKNTIANIRRQLLCGLIPVFVALLSVAAAHGQSAYSNAVQNLGPAAYWPLQETTPPPGAYIETNIGSLGAVANMYYASDSPANVNGGQTGAIVGDSDTATEFLGTSQGFGAVPTTDHRVSLPPGGPFTVEFWANPLETGQYQGIICQRGPNGSGGNNASTNAGGWCFNQNYVPQEDIGATQSGALYGWSFAVYNGQGQWGGAEAFVPYMYGNSTLGNTWYYLVATFDGVNVRMFVNGIEQTTDAAPMPAGTSFLPDTWDPIEFGCSRGLGGNAWKGFLDEVAIYTNVLTDGQITNHYYQATNGNAIYKQTVLNDGAYMYWRMDAPNYSAPSYGYGFPVATNYGSLASSMQNLNTGANGVNAAIYQPGTVPGVQGPSYAGFGSPSYACAFNGLNAGVDAGYNATLNPTGSNTALTVTGWFMDNPCDNNGRWNAIVSHSDKSWRMKVHNGATVWDQGPGPDLTGPAINVNDGNWHMFAGVFDPVSKSNTLYIDATLFTSEVTSNYSFGSNTLDVFIGGAPDYTGTNGGYNTGQQFYAGRVAHIAYFTSALTFAQIQSLYSAAETPPNILIQPAAGISTNNGGTTNIFKVTASGAATLVYQWYLTNGNGVVALADTGTNIVGSASNILTLTNLVSNESGSYFVVISNNYGSATSTMSGLQVYSQPFITSQSPSVSLWQMYTNQNSLFTVTALGEAPLSYQWYTNGQPDTTAGTSSAYSLATVTLAMTGNSYYCVVSNSFGTATNTQITLAVSALPASLLNSAYGSNILALNPVGYWPMHEVEAPVQGDVETNLGTLGTNGTAFYGDWDINLKLNNQIDQFYRQLPGALVNDPDTATGFTRAPGSYLIVPHSSPQTTIKPPFTLETWVYPNDNNSYSVLIGQGGGAGVSGGGNYGGFDLQWSGTTNSFSLVIYNGSGTANNELKTTSVYEMNQWYHVVATYDGTNIALWINGQVPSYQSGANVYTNMAPDSWSPLCIGGGKWGTGGANDLFIGIMDEVAIYTNILSSNTIVQHYNDALTAANGVYKNDVLTNKPLLYYRMDAPAYTQPPRSQWPVLYNYGTNVGNGLYWPGTVPGSASAASITGLSSTAVTPLNGMGAFADAGSALPYNAYSYNPFSYTALFRTYPTDDRTWQSIMSGNDADYRGSVNGNSGHVVGHGANDASSTSTNFNDGNWHHMLVVAQHGVSTGLTGTTNYFTNLLFVDGLLQATNSSANTTNSLSDPGPEALIGNEFGFSITNSTGNPAGERCLSGIICEAAFFNYAVPTNIAATLFNNAGILPYFTIQPISATVNEGVNFTNISLANGSQINSITYQWYTNGVALSGQTSANLILTNVTSAMISTDYYAVATTSLGSVTSTVVSLNANAFPQITNQTPSTLNLTLYSGFSVTLSVSAVGAVPLHYSWHTNGAVVAGATNSAYTLSNVQFGQTYTNYCVVSNFVGTVTSAVWAVSVVAAPTNSFPRAVLALNPIGYWRLNEAEAGSGDDGVVCHDYVGGHYGTYTNTILGNNGYNVGDAAFPTYDPETSAGFGPNPAGYTANSLAYNINGVNFAAPYGSNATFTFQAWANSFGSSLNTPTVVAIGNYYGEEAAIDTGASVTAGKTWRFTIRTASGAAFNANSTLVANDQQWHFLVGVCDEVHSNITLYIDGIFATNANGITNGSGITNNPLVPMTIGSRSSTPGLTVPGTTSFDQNFNGYVNDVAVFNYALSSNQVLQEYLATGIAPTITLQPPANTNVGYGTTLVVPAAALGTAALSYQWMDNSGPVSTATNATLVVSNIIANDSYYLVVTNLYGTVTSGSVYVTVDVCPTIASDITPLTTTVVAGSSVTFTVDVAAEPPVTNGWQLDGNPVVNTSRISGATNMALTINPVEVGDAGTYQLFVSNSCGFVQSQPATLTVSNALSFFGGNGGGWTGQGTGASTLWQGGNILQLTFDKGNEANSAFYSEPLYVGGFEASFTYQVVTLGSLADGVTFCIQNDSRGAAAVGPGGGGLAYGGGTGNVVPSVAFQINLYTGAAGGTGVAFGENGTIGPNGPTAPLAFNTGDVISNYVVYNGTTMTVTMTDASQGTTFTTNMTVNIPGVLGTNLAYVGFTGADGGSDSSQQIGNFNFVSLPSLAAQASGTNLLLSWPLPIGAYSLEQSTNIGSSAHWTPVAATPTPVNGTTYQVTVPISGKTSFYQLILTNLPGNF